MNFGTIFVVVIATLIILGGARSVARRELTLTTAAFGRQRTVRYQGWQAVVGGLIWMVVGAVTLWFQFRS